MSTKKYVFLLLLGLGASCPGGRGLSRPSGLWRGRQIAWRRRRTLHITLRGFGLFCLGSQLRSVMREDILFTRLFSVVEGGPVVGDKLDSAAWSGQGAQVLVTGNVKADGPQVTMECKIYDVSTGKVLWGKEGSGPKLNARRLAHLSGSSHLSALRPARCGPHADCFRQ